MIKIYFPPSFRDTREHLMIRQGLENNPQVKLVDNAKESGFIFQFYYSKRHSQFHRQKFPPEKTVLIDYHDKPGWISLVKCFAYFKRSWVERVEMGEYCIKKPVPFPLHFHPITFAIMDEFILHERPERNILLTCTLRAEARNRNRLRVLSRLKKFHNPGKTQIGRYNKGAMAGFNDRNMKEYFRLQQRSRIIVTCNPDKWEGDHRTWEAFASGALVFVDKMYTPWPHSFIDGKHCIFYDLTDKGLALMEKKIWYFINYPKEAEKIAREGYAFAMKYHRTSNRIDEILEVIL